MERYALIAIVLLVNGWVQKSAGAEPSLPLAVLYVGKVDSSRAADFSRALKAHFARVTVADRIGFDPARTGRTDVVLLDWSQGESLPQDAVSPFGKLADWGKPTVLLGSAGLLLASNWQIIGGAG